MNGMNDRPQVTMLSTQGIEQIVGDEIIRHDVSDENGQPLTDDLYILRSNKLAEICENVARRIQRKTLQLARKNRTAHTEGADDDE